MKNLILIITVNVNVFFLPVLCIGQSANLLKNRFVLDLTLTDTIYSKNISQPVKGDKTNPQHYPESKDKGCQYMIEIKEDSDDNRLGKINSVLKNTKFTILKRDTLKIVKDSIYNNSRFIITENWTIDINLPDSLAKEKFRIRKLCQWQVGSKQSLHQRNEYGKYSEEKIITISLKSNPQEASYFLIPYGEWIISGNEFWINKIKEYTTASHSNLIELDKIQNFFNKRGVLFGLTSENIKTNKIVNYKVIVEHNSEIKLSHIDLMNPNSNRNLNFNFYKK